MERFVVAFNKVFEDGFFVLKAELNTHISELPQKILIKIFGRLRL